VSDELTRLILGALMPGVATAELEPWLVEAVAGGVESVCLFGEAVGSPERTRRTTSALHALSADLLVALDEESGEVTRVQARSGSSFLAPLALGSIDDVEVTRASGRLVGRLLAEVGIDWTLAPVADVNVDPSNPVIGVRSFGADSERAAGHVAAFVDGLQSEGIVACAKHFPGHGDTSVDSHEALPVLDASRAQLDQRELLPFRAAIDVGVASIMTGHLLVPCLDPDAPASLSPAITTGLIRDELGYDGVVITDAIEMGAVAGPGRAGLGRAAVDAILAGADVVCIGAADQEASLAACVGAIRRAVEEGELDGTRLTAAARGRQQLRSARRSSTPLPDPHADVRTVAVAAPASQAVTGDPALASRKVDVVRIAAAAGYAAGETGWGVADHLASSGVDVRCIDDASDARRDRELVVETRDPWKSADVMSGLVRALELRPDAVVVEFGWPTEPQPRARGWIVTRGASALSSAMAACVLSGADPTPAALSILSTPLEKP
jgi:beta-N-acetylhexosaminidase